MQDVSLFPQTALAPRPCRSVERVVITSVLIGLNHRISTTKRDDTQEKTLQNGRQEDEQGGLYQGPMHGRREGANPFEGHEREAEVFRLLPRDVARWIRRRRPSDRRQ